MASPTSLLKTALTCEAFNISCVRQLSRFHLRRLASLLMDTRTNPKHRKKIGNITSFKDMSQGLIGTMILSGSLKVLKTLM